MIVALMYDLGKGVLQNDEYAYVWYMRALSVGDKEAFSLIQGMYDQGRITKQNYDRAYERMSRMP